MKATVLLVFCVSVAACGAYMSLTTLFPWLALVVFFGIGAIGLALQLAGYGIHLIMTRDDFTVRSFGSSETHAWRDIEAVSVITQSHTSSVRYRLRNGGEGQLDDDFGVGVDQLAKIFEQRRLSAAAARTREMR